MVRSDFATTDQDAAFELCKSMYESDPPRASGRQDGFSFRLRSMAAGALDLGVLSDSTTAAATMDPLDSYLSPVVLRGNLRLSAGGEEHSLGPRDAGLYRPGMRVPSCWSDVEVAMLRLPSESVAEVAAARIGMDPNDFRFDSMRPVSPAMARYWRHMVGYVFRELNAEDSALTQPLVLAETTSMVAAALLAVFPNTAMTAQLPGPGPIAPAALRRAVAYIDANAAHPVHLTEIAAASGVGPRGLQAAFTRHYDTSPTGYLRRVRLQRAHRELQAGDPTRGDTVAEIARRWGFGKPSNFAAAYRRQFGRSPGQTLRT
ncbi:MAG: AraC family transcriptional regulator [Actinocatenispora sp.]